MASTTTTYLGECPCRCGDAVEVEYGTFADTTVTVQACRKQRSAGILDYTLRKSAAPREARGDSLVRHSTGLVWIA